jgi:alpha-glucosidase
MRIHRHLRLLLLFIGLPVSITFAANESVQTARAAQIGDGIAWFIPSGYDAKKTPSLALVAEPQELGALPADWKLKPAFFTKDGGACASVAVPRGASLYGGGEVAGPLLRNDLSIGLWNTDNFAYEKEGGRRLYQTHPWVMGVRPDGSAFGVLFDTTWKGGLHTGSDKITLSSEGAPFRVAVIDRESPQAVMRGLAELTGKMPLPPLWALGFHQCRYSYYPDARVREIADEFRKRKLPCDVIWLDIHYMHGYRVFTFDPKHFPDPKATNDYLHEHGFKSVWMIDPGVKQEKGYAVFDTGTEADVWLKDANGKNYEGKVWPGMCVFPDFTRPETRAWWAGLYKDFIAKGVDGVWNDMNEPAVFDTPDWTMPEDNWHRGGGDLPPGPHKLYHNVYGMLMVRATREGVLAARPETRPFVLTRSNHLGGHRYAATWTGDNKDTMTFLTQSIPMSLTLGLSGQPISGPDIGGYAGKCTPTVFGRWMALGAFYPFSRAHTSVDDPSKEPWTFGTEIENVSRTALERRYRLMPYFYTLARNAAETGEPIMRPVFFADPKDPALRAEQQAFLLGGDLLVVPQWAEKPALPKGVWRDVFLVDQKRESDQYQPKVKIRGGAIVPLGKVVQSTAEPSLDPLTLLVCLDKDGRAEGALYEDAGDGFGYRDGEFALTHYTATTEGGEIVVRIKNKEGRMEIPDREIVVEVVGDGGVLRAKGRALEGVRVR